MPTLTLKNVPADLHRRLKRLAEASDRSLNSEILWCLRAAVEARPVDPDEVLARARALRHRFHGRLTARALGAFKTAGRA